VSFCADAANTRSVSQNENNKGTVFMNSFYKQAL
jgi:hypothetical protein